MNCIHCKKEIEDGAVFCPFCGGKQKEASQDVNSGEKTGETVKAEQESLNSGTEKESTAAGSAAGENVKPGAGQQPQQQLNPSRVSYVQPVQTEPVQPQSVQMQQGVQGNKGNAGGSSQAGSLMGDLTEIFKGIFSEPKNVLKNTFKKGNLILALILIGVQSVFSGFMAMGLMKGVSKAAFGSLYSYMGLPYVKLFFMGFLGAAGINALMALFLFVFLGNISKKDITFQSALCAVGMKALANIPFLFLACIGGLIALWLGLVFAVSGMILGYIYMYTAVPEDTSKTVNPVYGKYLSSLCAVLSSMLWIYILYKMFF